MYRLGKDASAIASLLLYGSSHTDIQDVEASLLPQGSNDDNQTAPIDDPWAHAEVVMAR